MRRVLPNRQENIWTQKFSIGGEHGGTVVFLSPGHYKDGTLGEIFLDSPKQGTLLRGFLHCFAISISIGLQHGVPLSEYNDAFIDYSFEPNGKVFGSDYVTECESIIDCVFQQLKQIYENNMESN